MEVITKYKADDGLEFTDEELCIIHECNCNYGKSIMKKLADRPDSCDFSNGGGYIHHDSLHILSVRNEFLEFCKRYTDHKWIQETIDGGFNVDPSWAGRMIGESAPNSIYKMWYRFSCIDKHGREWGHPYYVINPYKAKNVRLNKEQQCQ